MADNLSWLDSLADFLIARHINASIAPDDLELRRSMLSGAPEAWAQTERRFRCIAVVGAGASAPVLERGDDLAMSLIQQFHVDQKAVQAEHDRLKRITAVDPVEFESQLAAIGATVGDARRVRAAISELYNVRHPTVQAYELIAHLLKHRFLDAVISMNFDELLDQSLEDELGVGEYERIVSDRDCVNVQTTPERDDYIPLYIKLHGTASEPESLRFTRESYYDSPVGVGTVTTELFDIPECVVLNVGFGMGSFDLHRLLARPDRLWLFDLSKKELEQKAKDAIEQERNEHEKEEAKHRPKQGEGGGGIDSDGQMRTLLERIGSRGTKLLKRAPSVISLRSVKRHEAISNLLGPCSAPGRKLIELPRGLDDPRFSVDPHVRAANPDDTYADYLWRRAILELAMAMARGRGLISIGALAVDRGGHYFDEYRRYAGREQESWRDLYTLVGFEQDEKVPDIFQAMAEIRSDAARGGGEKWHDLPEVDMAKLAKRILPYVVDAPSDDDERLLRDTLIDLGEGTEYELHSRDDRVCEKTFTEPMTLKTISAHDIYSFELIRLAADDAPDSQVDIISETGDWLVDRKDLAKKLAEVETVRLIVAFTTDVERLRSKFPKLTVTQQQPWQHNRHMVIVKRRGEPRRALYFARHHRTPYVTPVFVRRRRDIRVLETTFEDRWDKADRV
jgi:hypothetical protein